MKDKEGRNGARRYMAEELYVENTGYPYLTSCSGPIEKAPILFAQL